MLTFNYILDNDFSYHDQDDVGKIVLQRSHGDPFETCGINYLDEIAYLDGIYDVDTTIKGVTNLGGTVTTGRGVTVNTSRNNIIHVSIRAVANVKLFVYYFKHMESVQCHPFANEISLILFRSY
jgi:hypothetical protein